jgi:transcriptional accessory protein Tex/SPT6
VKAHVGIRGKEMADWLAKEETQNHNETCSRMPKSAIKSDNREQSIRKWQSQWKETTKWAVTKEFFPSAEGRLAANLNLSANITAKMTGHVKLRSYI